MTFARSSLLKTRSPEYPAGKAAQKEKNKNKKKKKKKNKKKKKKKKKKKNLTMLLNTIGKLVLAGLMLQLDNDRSPRWWLLKWLMYALRLANVTCCCVPTSQC